MPSLSVIGLYIFFFVACSCVVFLHVLFGVLKKSILRKSVDGYFELFHGNGHFIWAAVLRTMIYVAQWLFIVSAW